MSQEDVEIVRKLYELAAEGGWDSPELMEFYARMIHPDFEFVMSGDWFPDAGVYRGITTFRDGKVVRLVPYDRAAALEAARLRE